MIIEVKDGSVNPCTITALIIKKKKLHIKDEISLKNEEKLFDFFTISFGFFLLVGAVFRRLSWP
jgi:hypothetical protein